MFSSPDWQSPDAARLESALPEHAPRAAEVHAERVRRRPWRRRLLTLLGLVPVLSAIALGGLWISTIPVRRAVQAELARIAAAGEPVTVDDLERLYAADTQEGEATDRWLAALDRLVASGFQDDAAELARAFGHHALIPHVGVEWPHWDAAEELLDVYRPILNEIHTAAEDAGVCRYTADLTLGYFSEFPYLNRVILAARAIRMEGLVCAHRRDAVGVSRCVNTLRAIATSLEAEPKSISQLLRLGVLTTAHQVTQYSAPHVEFSAEELASISAQLRTEDHIGPSHRGMLGERVQLWTAINDPESQGGIPIPDRLSLLWQIQRWYDRQFLLNHMRPLVDASAEPMPAAFVTARLAADALREERNGGTLSKLRNIWSLFLIENQDWHFAARGRAEASRDATLVVLAVERYHREHGRRPERLEELVPAYLNEVPRDPFDGQPLRYVVREGHYTIYSVGPDGIDDGGQMDAEGDSPDLVFTVHHSLPGAGIEGADDP